MDKSYHQTSSQLPDSGQFPDEPGVELTLLQPSTAGTAAAAAAGGTAAAAGAGTPGKSFIRAHRIFTRRFNYSGFTKQSTVMVSLSEIRRSNPAGGLDTPFVGNATMKVYNVSPENGFTWVRGEIDWDSDLDIQVSFLIF